MKIINKLLLISLLALAHSNIYALGWGGLDRSNVPGVTSADSGTLFNDVTAKSDYVLLGQCGVEATLTVSGGCGRSDVTVVSILGSCNDYSESADVTMTASSVTACSIIYWADAFLNTPEEITQVIKVNQNVVWSGAAGSVLVGGSDYSVSAVAKTTDLVTATGMGVTLSSNTLGVCTITGGLVHNVALGTCTIQADVAGDANLAVATKTTSWAITDSLPLLTLAATVTNDGGGTAVDTDFTLQASGPTTISGVEGNASITVVLLAEGSYSLSESSLANYYKSLWSCTAGSLVGAVVTLAINDVAVCTMNYDDGTLVISKSQSVIADGFSVAGKEKSMPGATVRYTITLDNSTGVIAATNLDVIDNFDDSLLTYNVNSVTVNGEAVNDGGTAVGAGSPASITISDQGGAAESDQIRVQGFTVPAGDSWEITFDVGVD